MPDKAPNAEERAKRYSVYLRPWVLDRDDASPAVPHITHLRAEYKRRSSSDPIPSARRRLNKKTKVAVEDAWEESSFALAWRGYIRHSIVSLHAKRIISQFMAACCGKSKTEDVPINEASVLPTLAEKNAPVNMALERVHQILRDAGKGSTQSAEQTESAEVGVDELKTSVQIKTSLQLGSSLWSLEKVAWGDTAVNTSGHRPLLTNAPVNSTTRKSDSLIKEKVYVKLSAKSVDAWFGKIKKGKIRPNREQLAYLEDVKNRCVREAQELKNFDATKKQNPQTEPYRKGLLGPPGTGKSECLRWTRSFFEEVLGWTDGVQFQYVAPQHTMALLIGGTTVHSFGAVPINATAAQESRAKKKNSDVDDLFERVQSLRWLLVDEIEALAAAVFGILDSNLTRALQRSPYAKRRDGSNRPFGGLNLSVSGDWWQLPPVRAIGFYSNPFSSEMDYSEQVAMSFFWRPSIN